MLATMDSTLMEDLDRQINSVMDCNPLLEDEVVRLCEKVWPLLYQPLCRCRPCPTPVRTPRISAACHGSSSDV